VLNTTLAHRLRRQAAQPRITPCLSQLTPVVWNRNGRTANRNISAGVNGFINYGVNPLALCSTAFSSQIDRAIITYLNIIAGMPVTQGIIIFARHNAD